MMSIGRKIAVAIWMLAGVVWLFGLISILRSPVPALPSMPLEASPILILPFIFFATVGALSPRPSPNATARSALLADIGRNLNVQVLFGVLCIMFGVLNFIQAFRAGKLLDACMSYGFFFSGGLGILAGQMMLARRGSPGSDATQSDQPDSSLLASIRRLRATNLTAFFTGIWTLLGMLGMEVLLSRFDLDKSIGVGLVFVMSSLVFFLIPALIFVLGVQNIDPGTPVFSMARLKLQGIVGVRALCWFFGTMAAAFSLDVIRRLFGP